MVSNAASPTATEPARRPGASSKLACCELSFGSTSGSGEPAGATTKETAADCPPSACGLTTVTRSLPGDAVSAVERNATNCVLLMNVVVLFCPFHRTTDWPEMKFAPLTVIEKGPPPAVTDCGTMALIVGGGGALSGTTLKV